MMKNASLMVSIISLSVFLIVSYTIPAADFNGDGTNDIGIFRPTSGLWAIRGVTRVYFGSSGDDPMPGDYNGDGTVDIGLFRSSSGLWAVKGITRIYYGGASDEPLVGLMAAGGGGNLWSKNGSNIYFNNGYVGIGTATPAAKLDIKSAANNWATIRIDQTGPTKYYCGLGLDRDSAVKWWVGMNNSADDHLIIGRNADSDDLVIDHDNGHVGIGTGAWAGPQLVVDGQILMHDDPNLSYGVGYSGIMSSGGQLWAIDSSGNFKLLSPHDPETGEWIFYSKNLKTGRVVRVDMERMVLKIEELTGEKFLVEKWEKPEEIMGSKISASGKTGVISKTLSTAQPDIKGHPSSDKDAAPPALLRRILALEDEISILKKSVKDEPGR